MLLLGEALKLQQGSWVSYRVAVGHSACLSSSIEKLRVPLELQRGFHGSTRGVVGSSGSSLIGRILKDPLDLQWGILSSCLGETHLYQGRTGWLLSCCNVRVATH